MNTLLWLAEKSLLTGVWPKDTRSEVSAYSLAERVCNCDFKQVLTSPDAQNLLRIKGDFGACDRRLLDEPLASWLSIPQPQESEHEEFLRLCVAISCLHVFVQTNWTGPDPNVKASEMLMAPADLTMVTEEDLNHKAIAELSYGGEPCYHLARNATFLRLALILLDVPFQHCCSAPWWRLRAALVHQQTLDEPVILEATIPSGLQPLQEQLQGNDPALHGRLLLEQGLLQHHFHSDKAAADLLISAARATGLEYMLTGALGKRTKFQQTELSQLILLAESHLKVSDEEEDSNNSSGNPGVLQNRPSEENYYSGKLPETLPLNDDTLLEQTVYTSSSHTRENGRLAHLDPSSQPPLHPLDQCILLGLCLNVKNTSPIHGLTSEQMLPYVARVISHPRNWTVHTMALLLRARLESTRTRTIERAVLQLQALIDQMPTADSEVKERLAYFHEIELPSKWEMEKELANRFLALGVVKSAMEIYERLEMWEEVVKCWQAIERPEKAIAIVRDLLDGRKTEADAVLNQGKGAISAVRRQTLDVVREAKLWCLLGDLEAANAVEHYRRAWEVSRQTSGRAVRSLGGYYFARANWTAAIENLKKAVVINPLLSRSWFILGCAYVKLEDWEGARGAFARCVSIDDEDGESWNNLASTYLRLGQAGKNVTNDSSVDDEQQGAIPSNSTTIQSKSADNEAVLARDVSIPFSNKMLAFRALKQGLKFSYENWRMWYNYMIVAMDVGELAEAGRALRRVVEQTGLKTGSMPIVDEDVLDTLVNAVTRASHPDGGDVEGRGQVPGGLNPNEGAGLLRNVLGLIEDVILPRISSSPRVFRAYARLLTWQGRWADAIKAHLDAYRCRRSSRSGETSEEAAESVEGWREEVREVEEIVDVLRNFGPKVEAAEQQAGTEHGGNASIEASSSSKWKIQARSIVRTFMARHKDYEDEPEWNGLVELLPSRTA